MSRQSSASRRVAGRKRGPQPGDVEVRQCLRQCPRRSGRVKHSLSRISGIALAMAFFASIQREWSGQRSLRAFHTRSRRHSRRRFDCAQLLHKCMYKRVCGFHGLWVCVCVCVQDRLFVHRMAIGSCAAASAAVTGIEDTRFRNGCDFVWLRTTENRLVATHMHSSCLQRKAGDPCAEQGRVILARHGFPTIISLFMCSNVCVCVCAVSLQTTLGLGACGVHLLIDSPDLCIYRVHTFGY